MRSLTMVFYIAVLSVLLTSFAMSWGDITHMYLVKHLGTKPGPVYFSQMYGAIIPDAFNFMLDANGQYLYLQTHQNFQPFYDLAWRHNLKEVAFGFITHNELSCGDWTAHINGYTTDGGYAVEKGASLAPSLVPTIITILTDAGLDPTTAEAVANGIAPELGHGLVESAVDILVKRNLDQSIGKQMYLAALTRPKTVPLLLSAAYAQGLADFAGIPKEQATMMIIESENGYRQYILQYGQAFMLPESQTIAILSAQTAQLAKMYLEAATGNAVTVTVAPEQVAYFLAAAMDIVQPDYAEELSLTLNHIKEVMESYSGKTSASLNGDGVNEKGLSETKLTEYSLNQNYPNPFNPTTSISYSLPVDAYVSLKIYNMLGQEIATLVDGELSAGEHIATWNASDVPSGIYICRIHAGTFSATKQLMLVK
jgi:Secretion system C-terminal sorting domain